MATDPPVAELDLARRWASRSYEWDHAAVAYHNEAKQSAHVICYLAHTIANMESAAMRANFETFRQAIVFHEGYFLAHVRYIRPYPIVHHVRNAIGDFIRAGWSVLDEASPAPISRLHDALDILLSSCYRFC